MLKIVLCEDNIQEQQEWYQMLRHILFDREDFEVKCYQDGWELIQAVEQDGEFYADLILMDIRMPKLDGIRTAELLREKQVDAAIIFITAHSEYVFQGYEVHAYDYLMKPLTTQKLERTLQRYLGELGKNDRQHLVVGKRAGGGRISLKHVLYFVSDKRKIRAVLEAPHESVEFYMKMGDLEEVLRDCGFLRCHQSFLINMHKVQSWDGNGVHLPGQEKIPVSRRYRGVMGEAMEQYQMLHGNGQK